MIRKTIILFLVFFVHLGGFAQKADLKILSWNIFMIPPTIFKSCQCERTGYISDIVKEWNADVIVFQEAFQKKARNLIWEKIKDVYPYQTGVPKSGFLQTHSGVWIVSKYPIVRQESIVYNDKKGSDRFARKGATFIEIDMNGKKIQVIGTHAQSGAEYQAIRNLQFHQLIDELGNKYMDFTIPQFIVGDLNTDYQLYREYRNMLMILDAAEIKHVGEPFSWNGKENNLGAKFFGTHQEILDYILVRNQHTMIANIFKEEIYSSLTKIPVCKRGFKAMSDHSPVMAKIELN
jgi:endonuclease/exonuclease/phosphatase family metal-dependent hydrolase